MLKSQALDQVFAAFVAAQAEMPTVNRSREVKVKTRSGGTYAFKYAPLDAVIETVREVYGRHGLAVTQMLSVNGIETLIVHQSGQYFGSTWPIEEHLTHVVREVVDGEQVLDRRPVSPQDAGGVITYFKRYAYGAINNLALDDDDDGNLASGNDMTVVKDKATLTPVTAPKTVTKSAPNSPPPAPAKTPTPEPEAVDDAKEEQAPWEEGFNPLSLEWDDVYETQLREYLAGYDNVKTMMSDVQGLLKQIGSDHGNDTKTQWRGKYQDIVQEVAQQIANR
jgi:hypothetical protein